MRACFGSLTILSVLTPATAAAADVIDFTTGVVTAGSVIDRLPGATVSRSVSGIYPDGLAPFNGGAYNYYGANDLYITFDVPTGLGTVDVWVLPTSLDHLPPVATLTFEMTDAAGALIGEVSYTPTGKQDTVTLGGASVTTLTIHHSGGEDFYGDGYLSAWYWLDNLMLTTCGDGLVEEECDDSNLDDGDGCASDCTIEDGWTCSGEPSVCSDIDECADEADVCPENATCENTVGAYRCTCNEGYTLDAELCVDIDECADGTSACDDNAACTNLDGTYDCTCNDGFEGDGFTCEPVEDGSSSDDSGSDGAGSDGAGDGGSGDDSPGSKTCGTAGGPAPLFWFAVLALVPLVRRRG